MVTYCKKNNIFLMVVFIVVGMYKVLFAAPYTANINEENNLKNIEEKIKSYNVKVFPMDQYVKFVIPYTEIFTKKSGDENFEK